MRKILACENTGTLTLANSEKKARALSAVDERSEAKKVQNCRSQCNARIMKPLGKIKEKDKISAVMSEKAPKIVFRR